MKRNLKYEVESAPTILMDNLPAHVTVKTGVDDMVKIRASGFKKNISVDFNITEIIIKGQVVVENIFDAKIIPAIRKFFKIEQKPTTIIIEVPTNTNFEIKNVFDLSLYIIKNKNFNLVMANDDKAVIKGNFGEVKAITKDKSNLIIKGHCDNFTGDIKDKSHFNHEECTFSKMTYDRGNVANVIPRARL